MSEMETHRGKLVPMILAGVTLEENAKNACVKLGLKRDDYHKSWLECLNDEGYRKVLVRGGIIYEIQDTELESSGFVEGTINDDGSYDYFVSYYNGGASLNEVLESAVKKAEKSGG